MPTGIHLPCSLVRTGSGFDESTNPPRGAAVTFGEIDAVETFDAGDAIGARSTEGSTER